MINILIAFYSRNGSTEALAKAVAEGARSKGGDVRLRRARDFVDPAIIAQVPGWADNKARMEVDYGWHGCCSRHPMASPTRQAACRRWKRVCAF